MMRAQVTWAVMDILEVSWGRGQTTSFLLYVHERRKFDVTIYARENSQRPWVRSGDC